jgi:hypothetical protein
MNRKIFIVVLALLTAYLYSETVNFNIGDYTFYNDSMTVKYKEKVYKTFSFSTLKVDVVMQEVRFTGQYAESVTINSYDSVLVKPDLGFTYFNQDTLPFGDKFPRKPVAVAARGIKRHGGFSVYELNPFFIKNDSLYFITAVNFTPSNMKKYEIPAVKTGSLEKIDLAIITTAEYVDNFEIYRDLKTKQGLETVIKTVEEIYAEYPGESNVIKIRNYIKDRYVQNDLEFVIIGGSYDIIPVGEAQPYISTNTGPVYADTFYSHLDGDQDGNGNGIYCELEDEPDYYADVYVGRFPGSTEAEMDAIINKTVTYYSEYRNYRTGFNTSAFLAGFTVETAGDGRKYCNNIKTELTAEFQVDSMYEGVTPDFNFDNMMSKFNSGYNFVYTQSHGDLHLIRQKDNLFKIWSDQILNTDSLSGLYMIASCEPGSIDKDSFSRKAMINPTGGCVNYIGMSGEEWPTSSNNMHAYIFNGLFRNRSYGESFANAAIMYGSIEGNSTGRYLDFGYAFQGDPSNRPFLNEPLNLTINSISQIKRGKGTVTGSFSSAPNDTLHVTLTDGERIISTTKTSVSGFTIEYEGLTSDSAYISFYSQEVFLKTAGFPTTAPDEIEFNITNTALNDANLSGVVEHGENFGINFRINLDSNPSSTDSLVAKITGSDHSEISILNGVKRFRLPTAGSYYNISAFNISFASAHTLVSDSVAVLDLEIQKKDGTKLYSEKLRVPVAVPYLKLQSYTRTGNTLYPKFINNSKGTIDKAEITISGGTKSTVLLRKIRGYSIVSDSILFTVDSTKSYSLSTEINDGFVYNNGDVSFDFLQQQPVVLYADHSPGKINLEWTHSYTGEISYNVYMSSDENLSTKVQVNDETVKSKKYSFNYNNTDPLYIQIALADSAGYEFSYSEVKKVVQIPLYKNTEFRIAPFQLYNPVHVDGKLISNSQNSTVAGINSNGTPVNGTGLIHEAENNGFSGEMQQGFAIGDIDGNGSNDIVNYSFNNVGDSTLVKVIDLTSGSVISQRKIYGYIMENAPVLVNADADDQLEILISVFNGNIGGTPAKGSYVYMLDLNGNSLLTAPGFPVYSSFSSYTVHSPSIIDLNGDGVKELIFNCGSRIVLYNMSTMSKIADFNTGYTIQTSLSYCDINQDGNTEVFALTESSGSSGKLLCYNFNGTTLTVNQACPTGINVNMKSPGFYDLTPPVSFADIDDNGTIEMIVLTASKLYVLDSDFTSYANFPVSLDGRITKNNSSAPSIADLDGDGHLDILFYDANYRMQAYSGSSGVLLEGFPILIEYMDRFEMTSPAVTDLDSDGDLEFAIGADDGKMLVYDYQIATSGRPVFDKYRGDIRNSGMFFPLVVTSPTGVSITSSAADVTVSWNAVSGATKYIIYSSSDPEGTFTYETETTGLSYTAGVSSSKKFYYVTAVR